MIKKMIPITFLCAALVSCATTGITSKKSGAWAYDKPAKQTARLGSIQVDKTASYSVEHEIAVLLPLLFLENGIVFPAEGQPADYTVDVHAAERDYVSGWKTRKSLSLEVYLRHNRDALNPETAAAAAASAAAFDVITPDAAARVRASGRLGFSSSKNLEYLLRLCVKKAAARLPGSQPRDEK